MTAVSELLKNADGSITNRPVGSVTVVRRAFPKLSHPMFVTELGIVNVPRFVPVKADVPILVTLLGMFTVDNELEKANR